MQQYQWSLKPLVKDGTPGWLFEATGWKEGGKKFASLARNWGEYEDIDPYGAKAFQKWQNAVIRSLAVEP